MRYLAAIFVFGLIVTFHELAHVAAARAFKIHVERFSFGLGPPLLVIRRGVTEYIVGVFPLGAHARILGLNPQAEALQNAGKRAFSHRSPGVRLAVLLSGSVANFVLALAALTLLHFLGTHVPSPLTVGGVEPASPAAKAGVRPGDVIVSVSGVPVKTWDDWLDRVEATGGSAFTLSLLREGNPVEVRAVPKPDAHGQLRIGLAQQYIFQKQERFADALRMAWRHCGAVLLQGLRLTGQLLKGDSLPNALLWLRHAADGTSSGFGGWLRLTGGLSLALMMFNLLPLPAFDGGRAVIVLLEVMTGRRLAPAREAWLHTVGFWVMLAAVVWVALANLV